MFIWNFDDKRKTFMEILKKWFEFQLVIKKIIKTVESVSIFYNKIFHYWFFNFVIKKKKKTKQKKQPHLKPFENAHFMNCSHQATRVAKFKMSPVPLFKREKKTFVFWKKRLKQNLPMD